MKHKYNRWYDELHYSSVARALGNFGETSLTDNQGINLLYRDVIVLNVSTNNSNNMICTPYYIEGIWAVQVKQISGTYETGIITINTLYIDRKW